MNSLYKIGVILFGVLLPLLVIGLIMGVVSSRKQKMAQEYEVRKKRLFANKMQEKAVKQLETTVSQYDDRKGSWEVLLENSDIGSVTGLLKKISSEYKGSETFKQDGFNYVNQKNGIGTLSLQPSVSFNVSMSGTFQAIQQSLLSLESEMPNLSLNKMKLSPSSSSSLLEAELSYSAWTR